MVFGYLWNDNIFSLVTFYKNFASKMAASKMVAFDLSHFVDFEHVKVFSSYFTDFEQ